MKHEKFYDVLNESYNKYGESLFSNNRLLFKGMVEDRIGNDCYENQLLSLFLKLYDQLNVFEYISDYGYAAGMDRMLIILGDLDNAIDLVNAIVLTKFDRDCCNDNQLI